MTSTDLDAIHRDTSVVLTDWPRSKDMAWAFRVYEQPAFEVGGEDIPAEWTVEIRIGRSCCDLSRILTFPVECWELMRESQGAWRDLLRVELDAAADVVRAA